MTVTPNNYDILGVSKGCTFDDLKKAFRRKAMEHHPDNGGDADDFIKVKNAYLALTAICPTCQGTGEITKRRGMATTTVQCPTCWKEKK